MTKYILFLPFIFASLYTKAQDIKLSVVKTEYYKGYNCKYKLTADDRLYSKIIIKEKMITLYRLVNHQFSVTNIEYNYRVKEGRCGTTHYYGYQTDVVLDEKKSTLTVINSKRVLDNPQPITIMPRKVWHNESSKVIYYGVSL